MNPLRLLVVWKELNKVLKSEGVKRTLGAVFACLYALSFHVPALLPAQELFLQAATFFSAVGLAHAAHDYAKGK